jgi:hypothetical protein
MLLGFRDSTFEVGATDQGLFFLSATILHRASRLIFEFIGVYGPADHARSRSFLEELEAKVALSQYPVVVAGDFNLIRGSADKNNSNIDWSRVSLFNDSIARMDLGEIRRMGVPVLPGLISKPTRCVVCSTGFWFLLVGRVDSLLFPCVLKPELVLIIPP